MIRAELIHRDHPDSPLSFARGPSDVISRRLTTAGVEFTNPISGQPDVSYSFEAEYVMTLYLGTPAQKFVVIVDTGSDLVWVQCQPCNSPYQCYNTTLDPIFDPSASSSYSRVPCSDNSTCDPNLVSNVITHFQHYDSKSMSTRTIINSLLICSPVKHIC